MFLQISIENKIKINSKCRGKNPVPVTRKFIHSVISCMFSVCSKTTFLNMYYKNLTFIYT